MKLSVLDRLSIPLLMPTKGNFITLTLANDIQKKTRFRQVEIDVLKLRIEDGRWRWSETKDNGLDINFTDAENALIKQKLSELNEKNELSIDMLGLYDKFFGGKK